MGSDVTQPSGTEGADLVASHWPEWSESAYIDGSKVALARGTEAGRGSAAGFTGAEAVPLSDGSGIAADSLVTTYTSIGTNLEGLAAQHTAEAQGFALNGANHHATKTILASLAEDHDRAREALIAAGMTAGVPQPKMQEVLDELKEATTTAASNVGQANQETHRTLTESINTGAALSAPPSSMPGGAGLPADVPSALAPLLQMGTQGPQMASGAAGQLVSSLSGMTGAFVDPIGQLVSGIAQSAAPAAEGIVDVAAEGGAGADVADTQLASERSDDKDSRELAREISEKEEEPARDEPRDLRPGPAEGPAGDRDQVATTHLASSGNTVQLGSTTTHVSAGSMVADAPMGAPAQAGPAQAGGGAVGGAQAMGGPLPGAMGGSLGLGAPAGAPAAGRAGGPGSGGERRDGDQSEVTGAASAAALAVAVPDLFGGGDGAVSAEAIFGTRILAHLVHQDPRLNAAAVAVFPMDLGVYAVACTPDALGTLRGGVAAPHATMPLASLTSIPGEFRTAWAGMADPVVPLCDALKRGFLARPEAVVALRPSGAPVVDSDGVVIVDVSMEQLLSTDPVDDAATVAEQLVAYEHIAPIVEQMAVEWSVPSDMDLATAFRSMQSRAWYQHRDPEYVYAMAWWMVIEARTALAGGDADHAAALAWQLVALPPAEALVM